MSIKDVQDRLIERNSKPKPKKIDRIVKGVLIYWCAFVILAWVTFWVKDSVPDTLIQYGLGGGAPLRQREVAERTGISRSYVSRIEKKALEKLKAALEA